jgi:hypothetical protein
MLKSSLPLLGFGVPLLPVLKAGCLLLPNIEDLLEIEDLLNIEDLPTIEASTL